MDFEFLTSTQEEREQKEFELFMWFLTVRKQFINAKLNTKGHRIIAERVNSKDNQTVDTTDMIYSHPLLREDWISITSSRKDKISLHIINRNAIFQTVDMLEEFTHKLKAYVLEHYAQHPFYDTIDKSVVHVNGSLRLFGSTKYSKVNDENARGRFAWFSEEVPIGYTFLTGSRFDTQFIQKGISELEWKTTDTSLSEEKKEKRSRGRPKKEAQPETNIFGGVVHSPQKIKECLSILKNMYRDGWQHWNTIGRTIKRIADSQDTYTEAEYLSVYTEWSRSSSKYQHGCCDSVFRSVWGNPTFGTLDYYCTQSNPQAYEEIKKKYPMPRRVDETSISLTFIPPLIQKQYALDYSPDFLKDLLVILPDEYKIKMYTGYAIVNTFGLNETYLQVYKEWASTHPNYTDVLYNSVITNSHIPDNPVFLRTLMWTAQKHNTSAYDDLLQTYRGISIKLEYTPDITICSRYLSKEVYEHPSDVICVKGNMKNGKTFGLTEYIKQLPKDIKILVVMFRVSLVTEIQKQWEELGFEHYQTHSDYKRINSEETPRLIIQLDSLHKVNGKYDLLILDEIESTTSHLTSGHIQAFRPTYNAFKSYIKHTPKVFCMDATLQNATVDALFNKRSVTKVHNTYKTFSDYTSRFTHDISTFNTQIIQWLKQGKKLVVPTNSEKYAIKLQTLIESKQLTRPDGQPLRIGIKTKSLGKDITLDMWSTYDLFIYSPTIVAGISYEEHHFDICCAYFTNMSSDAEMCIQQLARVRNLTDKLFFIYTPTPSSKAYLPITDESIDKHIVNLITTGNMPEVSEEEPEVRVTGLHFDNYTGKVKKDIYYKLFHKFTKKSNLTKLNIYGYIKTILSEHGISCQRILPKKKKEFTTEDEEEHNQLTFIQSEYKAIGKQLKTQHIQSITDATPITQEEYTQLIKKTSEITNLQQNSITRFLLTDGLELAHDVELKQEDVKKKLPYLQGIRNRKMIQKEKSIAELLSEVKAKHANYYKKELENIVEGGDLSTEESDEKDLSEVSDDEETFKLIHRKIRLRERKKRRVLSGYAKETTRFRIQYDKKYIKMALCFEILQAFGYTHLQTQKVVPNWNTISHYLGQKEETFRTLFECEQIDFSYDDIPNDNKKHDKIKRRVMHYTQARLKHILGVNIEREHDHSEQYELTFI